jgi:hypothetical protein
MEASDVSWRVVAGRRSRLPPSGRRFRAFLSCGSAPPPTWAQSASYIRRSKWSDGVDAAVASPDTPTLNRLRRAPRDAVIADETPTLEKWRRPSSDFSLSTASRPVDGLRRCRRRGRSNLVWLGVRGHFDQSKFRSNPRIPESPDPCLANTGLARESIVDRVLPACSRSIQDGLSVGTDRLSCSPRRWSGGDRSSFHPIGEGHPIALGRSRCRICERSRPGACELCLPDRGGRNVARTGWGWVLLARAQRSAGVLLRVDQPWTLLVGIPL